MPTFENRFPVNKLQVETYCMKGRKVILKTFLHNRMPSIIQLRLVIFIFKLKNCPIFQFMLNVVLYGHT